ncbi:hypothetical protein CKAH01_18472 [Colletotrichum kahawae]|uniref:Uncharacterized protein n=1 Tax=Colletotrichum kahawae TaxID=34407 RepID=A0AAD9Y8Q4_COLKA|nr:hypothetical protein CKAH01_18472 [Colletotrichum kahawae]
MRCWVFTRNWRGFRPKWLKRRVVCYGFVRSGRR